MTLEPYEFHSRLRVFLGRQSAELADEESSRVAALNALEAEDTP